MQQISGLTPDPGQGLRPDDHPIGDPYDRLEVHLDPPVLQRCPDLLLNRMPAYRLSP